MSNRSLPARLLLRAVLNIVLVWLLTTFLGDYFYVVGGIPAVIIVGALFTLMNVLVRPVLDIVTLPFRLFAHILTTILVNGAFLWLTSVITRMLDSSNVILTIGGGVPGWILVSLILGFANWGMKVMLK